MIAKVFRALKLVYQKPNQILLTFGLFLFIFFLYLFLLPATFTGGKIGLFSFKFLTPLIIFFAFWLALFFALTLTFIIYSFRQRIKIVSKKESILAVFLAVLPGFLCCSPFLPTLLIIFGASTPAVFGLIGPLQGFFVTYRFYFYLASLVLVIWAFYLSAKNLVAACKPC